MRRPTGEQARFAWRTVAYVLVVALSVVGPIIDLSVALRVLAVVVGVLAALTVYYRVRYPWAFPAVAVLSVPLVGPALVYLAVISVTVRRRDRAAWAFVAVAVLAILIPSFANGGRSRSPAPTGPWRTSTGSSPTGPPTSSAYSCVCCWPR
ncbi:hypothetical protein GCM10025883_42150 [Mobilicoccus caccae]|uniref:Uncharacterized protein n=2 Tax=Mobilicoccus caccae TaxID=1859295 RepID=A0ABQ6IW53_9MICO|nr:hypothetical protein GCM10025883_42150 [Mobilicoccus caccae]